MPDSTLSKAMIDVLIEVVNGKTSLDELQKSFKKSKSWMTRIVNRLELEGFLVKKRHGISLQISLADTPFALSFRDVYISKPYLKYNRIFSGKNLHVLMSMLYAYKTTKDIGRIMNVQPRVISPRIRFLSNIGLIHRNKGKYKVREQETEIVKFLDSYRNFSKAGWVLWRFGNEIVIKTRKRESTKGELTGFNRYLGFGIEVQTNGYCWYYGKQKIDDNLVFIHSLLEIEDQRTLALAFAFFIKNNLYKGNKLRGLYQIAEKFDAFDLLQDMNVINFRLGKIKGDEMIYLSYLPSIDSRELKRQLRMYGVKNV